MTVLDPERITRIYDRIGRLQDWQSFYEDRATERLIDHAGFHAAHSVLELGCGTGRFAERLLTQHLPTDAPYVGIDISPRMVELAAERLRPWSARAEVRLGDISLTRAMPGGTIDRLVANYVLDLMSDERAKEVAFEAGRLLTPGGRLCLVSLTHGERRWTRLVSTAWQRVWSLRPGIVGGCRPIELVSYLGQHEWAIDHRSVVSAWGLSSEVLVASRAGEAQRGA